MIIKAIPPIVDPIIITNFLSTVYDLTVYSVQLISYEYGGLGNIGRSKGIYNFYGYKFQIGKFYATFIKFD